MRRNRSWLVAASVADLLFLYAPIAILIVFSFNASKLSARWQGFSLQWYAKLFSDEALLSSTLNSLILATVSTILATVLGVLTALALERRSFRGQQLRIGGAASTPDLTRSSDAQMKSAS